MDDLARSQRTRRTPVPCGRTPGTDLRARRSDLMIKKLAHHPKITGASSTSTQMRHTLHLLKTRVARLALCGALHAGCGGSAANPADARLEGEAGAGPTFEALFARYFAAGTPGHCATSGCHA